MSKTESGCPVNCIRPQSVAPLLVGTCSATSAASVDTHKHNPGVLHPSVRRETKSLFSEHDSDGSALQR